MSTTNITLRMDSDVKKDAEQLFDKLGLSMSAAINIFIRQALRTGSIPFQISLTEEEMFFEKLNKGISEAENGEIVSAESIFQQLRGKYGYGK